jgi:hypothetical protein
MAGWLAKTTQLLRPRHAPEPPPPYEVDCSCGHHLRGMRQPVFQAVTCPRCGNPRFILPADVYPRPKVKKAKVKSAPLAPAVDPTPRVKAAQPVPVPSTHASGSKPAQAPGGAPARPSAAAGAGAAVRDEAKPAADSVIVPARGPLVSRFTLIVLAIAGVVTATGYFVWQSRLNDRALVSLPGHLEAGEAALRAGNVPVAADEYRLAAWAVDRLKRQDAESAGIRQKAKELGAIVNLSAVPLYDICEEAQRAKRAGPAKWTEKFNQLYRDSWVVVEGDVVEDTGPDGLGQPMVRFPFPIDNSPVVFDARLTALAALSGKGGGAQHVIFAGQLESLSKEGTKNPLWMIRLKDASAFLWADYDTWQALGLGADAAGDENEPRRILSQQAAALGLKP